MVETAIFPCLNGMAIFAFGPEVASMLVIPLMASSAFAWRLTEFDAGFVATGAGFSLMFALKQEISLPMIEMPFIEFDDAGIPSFMFGVTASAIF